MKNETLSNLSSDRLRERIQMAVRHERRIVAAVLEHLAEVDRRKLYLDWGFGSLFDYLTRELGYSESSAYRRMLAARALRQIPEIQEKIQTGELNLSQIVQVQKDLRREEVATGDRVSTEQKRKIFAQVCNKSLAETQKVLDHHLCVPREVQTYIEIRHRKDDSVDVSLNVPADLYQELERVKEIYSHIAPGANLIQVLHLMVKDVRKMRDPLLKQKVRSSPKKTTPCTMHAVHTMQNQQPINPSPQAIDPRPQAITKATRADSSPIRVHLPPAPHSPDVRPTNVISPDDHSSDVLTPKLSPKRATQSFAKAKVKSRQPIPTAVRRLVFQRDRGGCSICGSRHQVEIDHIQPIFAGGDNEITNLRLLCRSHNQHRYVVGSGRAL